MSPPVVQDQFLLFQFLRSLLDPRYVESWLFTNCSVKTWIQISSSNQCISSQPMAKVWLRTGDLLLRVPQAEENSQKKHCGGHPSGESLPAPCLGGAVGSSAWNVQPLACSGELGHCCSSCSRGLWNGYSGAGALISLLINGVFSS